MSTHVIAIGNSLRGEDAFGPDVAALLRKKSRYTIHECLQLTPELCLKLKDAEEIIFIDAACDAKHPYALAVPLARAQNRLSHQFGPFVLMQMLKTLYDHNPPFSVYAMLAADFDTVKNKRKYAAAVRKLHSHLLARPG